MNVLVNAFSARSGGGLTYLTNLLNFTPQLDGLNIYILCGDSLCIPATCSNITRIIVRWPTTNPLSRAVWERFFLHRLLRKLKIDILFCPGGIINARPHGGCKFVTMSRNMIPFDPSQYCRYPLGLERLRIWILSKVLLQSMIRADCVIFISHYAYRVIGKHAKGLLKKSVVIPHGLSEQFKVSTNTPVQPPYPFSGFEYLAYVSNLDYYKNQIEVIRAFSIIKRIRLTKEKLLLIGSNTSPYADLVRAEIQRLKLGDDVIITGPQPYEMLPPIYRCAKINIFASVCENCPNVLLEALGAGRPVVASYVPPMPEFGMDAPLYFDPNSPEDIAKKILVIIDDPTRLDQMARRARKRARCFDWQWTIQRTWETIKEVHSSSATT